MGDENNIFSANIQSNEMIKHSKIFKKGTLEGAEKMFEFAKIASEIKKEENDVYKDFLKHTSNYEDAVDIEKMKRIIPESTILRLMTEESFNDWRQKLFHTKLSFIDKTIEKVKQGKVENNMEIQEIDKKVISLYKQIDSLTENLNFY
jgi:hypothetical protein